MPFPPKSRLGRVLLAIFAAVLAVIIVLIASTGWARRTGCRAGRGAARANQAIAQLSGRRLPKSRGHPDGHERKHVENPPAVARRARAAGPTRTAAARPPAAHGL